MQQTKIYADDSTTRIGEISATELINRYPKFKQHYDSFEPEAEDIKNFSRLKNFELLVFFGLWCHDSQREVAHLLKLIKRSKTQFRRVKLVALNTRKVLMEEYTGKYKVTKTPTIFIVKNHRVLAEIIESPEESIAKDLLKQIFH